MSKTIKEKSLYILLGIGIGLIISSSVFIIKPIKQHSEYNDEEIIQKAKKLGMVFIKDAVKIDNENKEETTNQTKEDEKSAIPIENVSNKEYINFTIKKGESTESVSKRLFENGMIDDVDKFNDFICKKGLEKKIIYGDYEVKEGSTYEELIKLFTNVK